MYYKGQYMHSGGSYYVPEILSVHHVSTCLCTNWSIISSNASDGLIIIIYHFIIY